MSFLSKFDDKLKLPGAVLSLAGCFFAAAGWGWYHFFRHPKLMFLVKEVLLWFIFSGLVFFGKYLYRLISRKRKFGKFWGEIFYSQIDELVLLGSLFFLIFFIKDELFGVAVFAVLSFLFFFKIQHMLQFHPEAKSLRQANLQLYTVSIFLLIVEAVFQYFAFHYYILDGNIRFYNIVLFRSIALMFFWLLFYAVANLWYWQFKSKIRYLLLAVWSFSYLFFLILWGVNIGILYFSGLYFSPVAMEHFSGSGGVLNNKLTYALVLVVVVVMGLLGYLMKMVYSSQERVGKKRSLQYDFALIALGFLVIVSLSSFRNSPEAAIASSFYDYYFGGREEVKLDPAIQNKLKKFGLNFDPNAFYVNSRPQVFTPTTTKLLPDRLLKNKPNILMIELESFSSRLTDVYDDKFPGVTPNLKQFADDSHTTVFHHYYNASTPTITGTLSQLCSFLPPTGHNEIQNERKLQNHHLLCLPEVLKKQAGYKYAAYVTAVDKEFANKDGIFKSMDIDDIFGEAELKKYVQGEPLSWGYSDHQLFPTVWQMMQKAPEPFVMIYATVDTHPPFDLAKDAVNYGDGSQPVLNMFHTTDDAFGKFWQDFKNSPYYHNTIVVAVADHAIFPGALTKDLFPEDAKNLNYYDENFFGLYIPDSVLPKTVDIYSSALDMVPTLLQVMNINIPNGFEGHSIFDDRKDYPNLLGMHELGLYINQINANGKRSMLYNVPTEIRCGSNYSPSSTPNLTLCDFKQFYDWKRKMFEEGRFWKH